MTNNFNLFRTREELEEKEGAYLIGGNRFRSGRATTYRFMKERWCRHTRSPRRKYCCQPGEPNRPAQPASATQSRHRSPNWFPEPQFWIESEHPQTIRLPFVFAFKDVTAPTNIRSIITAALIKRGLRQYFAVGAWRSRQYGASRASCVGAAREFDPEGFRLCRSAKKFRVNPQLVDRRTTSSCSY